MNYGVGSHVERSKQANLSPLPLLLSLVIGVVTKALAATAPLIATIACSKTEVREGSLFTARIEVTNTTAQRANGVYLFSESMFLDDGWSGYAVPLRTAHPLLSGIPAGKSVTFVQQFRATTLGTFRLRGRVHSIVGDSDMAYSPYVTVIPKTVGRKAESDRDGNSVLALGKRRIQIHLSDEETGSHLSGMSLGLALDPHRPGQAVVAAVDPLNRYPLQFFLLQGPLEQTGAMPPTSALRSSGAVGVAPVVEIPINRACGTGGDVFTHVMAPIHTDLLPSLKGLRAPPSPGPDHTQPTFDVLLDALRAAGGSAKGFFIKKQTVTCDEVIRKDAEELLRQPFDDTAEGLVFGAVKRGVSLLAPEFTGLVQIDQLLRTIASNEGKISALRDALFLCSDDGVKLLSAYTFLPSLPQYSLVWNSPVTPDSTPVILAQAAVSATDPFGNPLTTGSIELVSSGSLGNGFRGVIDNGIANVPVAFDDYNWCVRSPGYQTQSGQLSVTSDNPTITVALQPQPATSGTLTSELGQPTGLLPAGTQFILTPHFFDKAGHEIACSGTPVFYVRNPVGSTVATVDSQTGLVTIQDGCGAALVTAWCDGVETGPKLISSDCNGTQPPKPATSFVVFPHALTFVASEGGANPPAQTIYNIVLKSGTLNLHARWAPSSWLHFAFGDESADVYSASISVDTAGLSAGTYSGYVYLYDADQPKHNSTIPVTLFVNPVPDAEVEGTWSGNWTQTNEYFGEEIDSNVTWNLTQDGPYVSGTYSQYVTRSDLDPSDVGRTFTGNLVNGYIHGNRLDIQSEGGNAFNMTIKGGTMSGVGGTKLFYGPINLQRR